MILPGEPFFEKRDLPLDPDLHLQNDWRESGNPGMPNFARFGENMLNRGSGGFAGLKK
jgi:hypothetical protein